MNVPVDAGSHLALVNGLQPREQARQNPDIGSEVRLKIIATSDLHANLLSYDYALNSPMFGQGLAQAASLIAEARSQDPNAILLDNGDFLQGNALADMASERRSTRPHPVIAAMNTLRYDAASLGNHEFNFGLGLLDRAISRAEFPILSANVLRKEGAAPLQDETYVPPFAILDRMVPDQHGQLQHLKIGILGLTPPEILQWDSRHLEGRLTARPMLDAARAWLPALRAAGAHLVICLAHTGIPQVGTAEVDRHAVDLARLDGVDILIAGHSHRVFPFKGISTNPDISPLTGLVCGKPAVQPGFNGSHVGIMNLTLRKKGSNWQLADAQVRAVSVSETVAGLPPGQIRRHAAPLRAVVEQDHRAALAWARRPVGRSDIAMSTFFAQVAQVPALALLAASKVAYARSHLPRAGFADLPVVAATTAYRVGGRGGVLNYSQLEQGGLSMWHVLDLLPFPNTIVVLRATAGEIREHLERSAAAFCTLQSGQADQQLIDEAFPTFAFTVFSGLSYRFDLSGPSRYSATGALIDPKAQRVSELTLDGRPLPDDKPFLLVTNSFRTGGAQGLAKPRPEDIVLDDNKLCSDVLKIFLQSHGRIAATDIAAMQGNETWGFKPLPDTSAFLDTGTAADAYLHEAAHLRPEFIGLTESGFRRYRLHL